MKLQHLALVQLSRTTEYPRHHPIISNMISEIEKIKDHLDEQIENQDTNINESLRDPAVDIGEYLDITYDINDILRSGFSYKTYIKTDEHVKWKEYFNCLVEYCVLDCDTEHFFHYTIKGFDMFEQPEELHCDDPCYDMVNNLKELFIKLKDEHNNILTRLMSPHDYLNFRFDKGRKHREMFRRRDRLFHKRNLLEDVMNWSRR